MFICSCCFVVVVFVAFVFLPGLNVPHIYVRALKLCCVHSLNSCQTFGRALTAGVDGCAERGGAP